MGGIWYFMGGGFENFQLMGGDPPPIVENPEDPGGNHASV